MSEVLDAVENNCYVVRGINWRATVMLDEDDMELPLDEKLLEAATKAIEGLYDLSEIEDLVIEGDTDVDIALIVAPKEEEDNDDAYKPVPTHVVLANAGLYRASIIVAKAWTKKMSQDEK